MEFIDGYEVPSDATLPTDQRVWVGFVTRVHTRLTVTNVFFYTRGCVNVYSLREDCKRELMVELTGVEWIT